jgi:hypothetical protein
MAIKRITKQAEFHEGMMICVSRELTVSGPVLITKVSPAQLTVTQEGKAKNVRRNGLSGYVVDTHEEGMALFQCLYDRERDIKKAESKAAAEARKKVMETWQPALDILLARDKN